MNTDVKIVLRNVGLLLHVPGSMALLSIPVAWALGEPFAGVPFLITALVSLGTAQFLYQGFRSAPPPRRSHGMLIAVFGWLAVPVFGALPFWLIAGPMGNPQVRAAEVTAYAPVLNSLFEAFSGFTSTGLTMAEKPADLPGSLQWWRSFMEWIGGVGVIVLMLSILRPESGAIHLYNSEARQEKIGPNVGSTVRTIWWIYLVYTLFSIGLLFVAGVPWWEAINHGMTGIATGGFSITNDSLSSYPVPVKFAVMLIMVLGAVSFAVHFQFLRYGRVTALWKDLQHVFFWLLLIVGAGCLVMENWLSNPDLSWIDSAFQWTSALCTAGFQTAPVEEWSVAAILWLSLAMMLGGVAGSTVGGIKQARVAVLYKGLVWQSQRMAQTSRQMQRFELDGKGLPPDQAIRMVRSAGLLAILWSTVLWIAIFVMLHVVPSDYTLEQIIFEVASAQGNVGLSAGVTSPELSGPGKVTLILVMWIGRLEIIPVFAFFAWFLGGWQPSAFSTMLPASRRIGRSRGNPALPHEQDASD